MSRRLKSSAVVLRGPKQPVEIREREVPSPARGCINIEVVRAGVCGTDAHLATGDTDIPVPVVLGHEGLGRIIELGPGVKTDHGGSPVEIGDVVYWNPIRPCHACYDCTVALDMTACENGTFWSPADQAEVWASYTQVATLLPNNSFYRVDQSVPLDAYIALGCALPTMLQAMDNLGGMAPASNVVVQGAGPVGLAAVMLAKLGGATNIVCIEANEARLQHARDFGANILVDMRDDALRTVEARAKHINGAVGERGVNLVIECSGAVSAFEEGMGLLARNGQYLLVGTWAGSSKVQISPFDVVRKALRVVGSTYCSPSSYYQAIKLVQAHHQTFPLADCVTHRYNLRDAQKALDDVLGGKVVKAVIYPQEA